MVDVIAAIVMAAAAFLVTGLWLGRRIGRKGVEALEAAVDDWTGEQPAKDGESTDLVLGREDDTTTNGDAADAPREGGHDEV